MKKIVKRFGVLFFVFGILLAGSLNVRAAGGSTTLSMQSSTVNIGDTVAVTLQVSSQAEGISHVLAHIDYQKELLEYTGSSSTDCNGGEGKLIMMAEFNGSYSIVINFKAKAPSDDSETDEKESTAITVTIIEAETETGNEQLVINGTTTSLVINNAVTDPDPEDGTGGGTGSGTGGSTGGGTGGSTGDGTGSGTGGGTGGSTGDGTGSGTGETPPKKQSSDNSLKSLTISPGTISPQFKYSTTRYTASVDKDVTSVVVDAKVSNSKATIESVTGNTNLQMGENTIKITVKAENGLIAVYRIVVTRGGTTEEPGNNPAENPGDDPSDDPGDNSGDGSETDFTGEISDKEIVINGVSYEVSEDFPENELPKEFSRAYASYGGKRVEAYTFYYQELLLVYLKPLETEEVTEGLYYFYNETAEEFFPYINIGVGQNYAVVLPNSFAQTIPEGFEETTTGIGEYTVTACQPISGDIEKTYEFYLVYGADKNGVTGWYKYDTVDISLQRFNEAGFSAGGASDINTSVYEEEYAKLQKKYSDEKTSARIVVAVLIFFLIVELIAIINIFLFVGGKKDKEEKYEEEIEEGNEEDVEYIDLDDM